MKQCKLEGRIPTKTRNLRYYNIPRSKALFETTNKLLYCPILKVGSTFLKRTLVAFSSNGTYDNPFEFFSRKSPSIYRLDRMKELFTRRQMKKVFNDAISFMAVRDPYTKLFSGYADKLFHPNYLFWRLAGQKIQWQIREDNGLKDEVMCGQDITFAEFVKYIIHVHEHKEKINSHFVTLNEYCDPCLVEFDYILKLETFKEDTTFLLDVLNKRSGLEIQITDFEQETAVDNAEQHVKISYATRKQYGTKCNIPAYSFLFRTWRYLQISGVIPNTATLPVKSESHALQITKEEFIGMISEVISKTKNWTEVRLQRKEALRQAYQSVERNDLAKLAEIFEPDCRYFDYDCNFETLLSKESIEAVKFDYFDAF